jgi:hypothetical protein
MDAKGSRSKKIEVTKKVEGSFFMHPLTVIGSGDAPPRFA